MILYQESKEEISEGMPEKIRIINCINIPLGPLFNKMFHEDDISIKFDINNSDFEVSLSNEFKEKLLKSKFEKFVNLSLFLKEVKTQLKDYYGDKLEKIFDFVKHEVNVKGWYAQGTVSDKYFDLEFHDEVLCDVDADILKYVYSKSVFIDSRDNEPIKKES